MHAHVSVRRKRWVPKVSPKGSVCCACAQRPGLPRQSFSRTLGSQKSQYFFEWVQNLGTLLALCLRRLLRCCAAGIDLHPKWWTCRTRSCKKRTPPLRKPRSAAQSCVRLALVPSSSSIALLLRAKRYYQCRSSGRFVEARGFAPHAAKAQSLVRLQPLLFAIASANSHAACLLCCIRAFASVCMCVGLCASPSLACVCDCFRLFSRHCLHHFSMFV
jgi:hypothetical protein